MPRDKMDFSIDNLFVLLPFLTPKNETSLRLI